MPIRTTSTAGSSTSNRVPRPASSPSSMSRDEVTVLAGASHLMPLEDPHGVAPLIA